MQNYKFSLNKQSFYNIIWHLQIFIVSLPRYIYYKNMKKDGFLYRTFDLYYDGFRSMKLGKTLWAIILIKLFIMFAILKVFFFPNYLKQHANEGQEDDFVATELIDRSAP